MTDLVLRRCAFNQPEDYRPGTDWDVFDGEQCVGRIYCTMNGGWFWGIYASDKGEAFQGHAASFDAAKAIVNAAYEKWNNCTARPSPE